MDNYDIAYSGRLDGKTHLLPVRIYYKDTDMSGIVYHGNYVDYFERGRTDFLRLMGVNHTDLANRDKPLAFAIISMDIRYKKASRIDDSLLVHTEYLSIKGAKIHIKQWITRNENGKEVIMSTNDVWAVIIDMQGNPQRPAPDVIAMFTPFLAGE